MHNSTALSALRATCQGRLNVLIWTKLSPEKMDPGSVFGLRFPWADNPTGVGPAHESGERVQPTTLPNLQVRRFLGENFPCELPLWVRGVGSTVKVAGVPGVDPQNFLYRSSHHQQEALRFFLYLWLQTWSNILCVLVPGS